MITLVFSGFSLILYLTYHTAKFRRSCCKSFAAKRTLSFRPIVQYDQRIGIVSFVCGAVLEGH